MDDTDFWISDSVDIAEEHSGTHGPNARFFQLELKPVGQPGDYHVRNKPGEKQRVVVSAFGARRRRRPAFTVECMAQIIIHGTLNQNSDALATLLVYDLAFFQYGQSARIVEADVRFNFVAKARDGGTTSPDGERPSVLKIAPYGEFETMKSTSDISRHIELAAAPNVGLQVGASLGSSKTLNHAARLTGSKPSNEWGQHFRAQWFMTENASGKTGVPSRLRCCILLERTTNDEFCCIPSIHAKADLRTQLSTLFDARENDDPIVFDPEYEPYNELNGILEVDTTNLGAVNMDELWHWRGPQALQTSLVVHVVCLSSNDDLAKARELVSEHMRNTTTRVYKFEYKVGNFASAELTRESLLEQAIILLDAMLRLRRPDVEVDITKVDPFELVLSDMLQKDTKQAIVLIGHELGSILVKKTECLLESKPLSIYENPRFRQWASEPGADILHLRGSSAESTRDLADQILTDWQQNFHMCDNDWFNVTFFLSFTFNSKDSLRSSLAELSVSDTPELVLDRTLRSKYGQDDLAFVLGFILCGFKPMNLEELSLLLVHKRAFHTQQLHKSTSVELAPSTAAQIDIRNWLRVAVDFGPCQYDIVMIRPTASKIINLHDNDTKWIWSQARTSSHELISKFCIASLTSSSIQDELREAFKAYESYCKDILQRVSTPTPAQAIAPMDLGSNTVIGLLIQSLPHHLSQCNSDHIEKVLIPLVFDDNQDLSLKPWAQAFWAMSNPLGRQKVAPRTPIIVLTALRTGASIKLIQQAMDEFKLDDVLDWDKEKSTVATAFATAVRAGNQDVALELANFFTKHSWFMPELASVEAADGDNFTAEALLKEGDLRPTSPLRDSLTDVFLAAVWQGMDQLIKLFLDNGYKPIATKKTCEPKSPLHLAAILGHARIVEVLLADPEYITNSAEQDASLEAASTAGHLSVVQAILEKGGILVNRSGLLAALRFASLRGNWKIVSDLLERIPRHLLLDSGSKAQDNSDNRRPLMKVCDLGFPKSLKALLVAGDDPDLPDTDGWTPLMCAVECGRNFDCIRLLIEFGANLQVMEFPAAHLICSAFTMGCHPRFDIKSLLQMADLLLENGMVVDARTSDENKTALMEACQVKMESKTLPVIRWLLEHGANVDAGIGDGWPPLGLALWAKNTHVVKELLRQDPKPKLNFLGPAYKNGRRVQFSPLSLAYNLEVEDDVIVEMLLQLGADPNLTQDASTSPLAQAVTRNSARRLRQLLEFGARVDLDLGNGVTILHLAVWSNPEIMRTLLEFRQHLNLEHRNASGSTALMAFGNENNFECIRILVRAGADYNTKDNEGNSPLIRAAILRVWPIFDLLLTQPGLDLNVISEQRGSALQVLCGYAASDPKALSAVVALLDHGADINSSCRNHFGTPLIEAISAREQVFEASDQRESLVRLLVRRGANVNLAPRVVIMDAIAMAAFSSTTVVINILIEKGCSVDKVREPTGRLPLHYAAANGLGNFKAILSSYHGEIMAPDRAGKNALHFAAQFGRAKVVQTILDSTKNCMPCDMSTELCVNVADADGWTPLCWAARGVKYNDMEYKVRSEHPDMIATIRLLLEYGAKTEVKCRMGQGEQAKEFTPLQLAHMSGQSSEIIKLLSRTPLQLGLNQEDRRHPGESIGQFNAGDGGKDIKKLIVETSPCQKWKSQGYVACDICISKVYGLYYRCQNAKCLEWDVCSKCINWIHIFHSPEWLKDPDVGQIEPHDFAVPEGVVEFEEQSEAKDEKTDVPDEDDLEFDDLDSEDW
ncbi:hypothetical protein PspLS_09976 [Pyricularia sp. CBS 133598]|nr:hypothetical protein PspLS_09976 [Pyricularia sp. CBS 133598]